MTLPKLVPATDVARTLGVQVQTLCRWSAAKAFPRMFHYGGRWHVDEVAVARWLEECPGDPDQDALRHDYRDCEARGVWTP